jgi:hypothetical protein
MAANVTGENVQAMLLQEYTYTFKVYLYFKSIAVHALGRLLTLCAQYIRIEDLFTCVI